MLQIFFIVHSWTKIVLRSTAKYREKLYFHQKIKRKEKIFFTAFVKLKEFFIVKWSFLIWYMAIVSKVWAIRPHRPLVTPVFFNATQRLSSCFDLDFSLNIDFSRCIYITSLPLNVNVFFFSKETALYLQSWGFFFNNMKTAQIRWHFSLRYLKFVVRWYSVNRILLSKIRSYL